MGGQGRAHFRLQSLAPGGGADEGQQVALVAVARHGAYPGHEGRLGYEVEARGGGPLAGGLPRMQVELDDAVD